MVSDEWLAGFLHRKSNPPTLDSFILDLRAKNHSKWNQAAAKRFSQGFIKNKHFHCEDPIAIKSAFTIYILKLIWHYDYQENIKNREYNSKLQKH